MDNVDDIYNAVLEYEEENNLQDPSAPEEGEDITLTPEELEYLEKKVTSSLHYQKAKV